ncbi:MAG TPA: Hpt domain-containing protein [Pyrinomonadaceae bacterium]|nr:Hpt domain-containing protein [Pyrinomonadaceae bacterium]
MSITNEAVQTVDLTILASFDEAQEEGEPDFVVELIDLYLQEAPRIFSTIREGLANNDWLTAKRAAHSLRGSSGNLGILQMALLAGALEHLTANQDASAAELLQGLEDEFTRVEEILLAERQRRLS